MPHSVVAPEVPPDEEHRRVAVELFSVARDSAPGALLTVAVMGVTHWRAQDLLTLLAWSGSVCIVLFLRWLAAWIYLSADAGQRQRWYAGLYGLLWVSFCATAVLWVLSLSLLGSGRDDTLFFVRAIFVIAVLSYYLGIIGTDRWLYAAFVSIICIGFWLDVVLCFPHFLHDLPNLPFALALYGGLLLMRGRSEHSRLRQSIRAQIAQDMLLEELRMHATFDALTGVYNRRQTELELRRLVKLVERLPGPLSVLLFDVDHFKEINDRYGHDMGDEVLRLLSTRVKEVLRESDILGRWGGEEFLVLLPNTELSSAMEAAERLRQAVLELKFDRGSDGPWGVTISLGCARHVPGLGGDDLCKQADLALYAAKRAGRNCCRSFLRKS